MTAATKSYSVKDWISWMLFDLVEGVLLIGTCIAIGLALGGAL